MRILYIIEPGIDKSTLLNAIQKEHIVQIIDHLDSIEEILINIAKHDCGLIIFHVHNVDKLLKILEIFQDQEISVFILIVVLNFTEEPYVRIKALNLGADQCISAATHYDEVLAIINACARRNIPSKKVLLKNGEVCLDLRKQTAIYGGKSIQLQLREFKILKVLMENINQFIPRQKLIEAVYGLNACSRNIIDVYICSIRAKINKKFIKTMKGRGYMIPELTTDS